MKIFKDVYEEYSDILHTMQGQKDAAYAIIQNKYALVSDYDDDEDEVEHLKKLTELAERMIVREFMENRGWFENRDEGILHWEFER